MKRITRYFVALVLSLSMSETVSAQVQSYKEPHEVKRKETIFGIARENNITIEELIKANPEMNTPGYELKKGSFIRIPFPSNSQNSQNSAASSTSQNVIASSVSAAKPMDKDDVRQRAIRLGVMLPLHDQNGDGKRMVEYYRGVLMACDSLKTKGISVDVCAWNVAEGTDISKVLKDPKAANRDLIIGPLYTKQVKTLGDFAQAHDIRVLIPFSTSSQEVYDNGNLFQAYQNGHVLNEAYVYRFCQRFKGCHPVLIDCNDTTSTKGGFTAALRRKLEQEGIQYSITNLRSSESMFRKAFDMNQRNVVILNTSRSSELNVAFAKLNGMITSTPGILITMFGYSEWLMYTRMYLDNFYKFDVYIPSTYYMDPLSVRSERIKRKYRWNFHQEMQNYHQRYAVTGFDHAFFMLKGLHLYGKHFTGASGMAGYTPLQTPLHFERMGNGGLQNKAILFVHYTTGNKVETINF
jgi:hypothetical protein